MVLLISRARLGEDGPSLVSRDVVNPASSLASSLSSAVWFTPGIPIDGPDWAVSGEDELLRRRRRVVAEGIESCGNGC